MWINEINLIDNLNKVKCETIHFSRRFFAAQQLFATDNVAGNDRQRIEHGNAIIGIILAKSHKPVGTWSIQNK